MIINYGLRLRQARMALGETASETAVAVGVSRQAIESYENNMRQPKDCTKVDLAKHFGRKVGDLFFSE